jgi:5-formyltetrahydrofolate cyclo-ligase
MPSDASAKAALRQDLIRARAEAHQRNPEAGITLAAQWPQDWRLPAGCCVAGYWPLAGEIDPRPLMRRLADQGARLCLPVMQGAGKPLLFRAWRDGDQLGSGAFGVSEPVESAAPCDPDVILLPLVGADLDGHRMGFGQGFYDRTLCSLRMRRRVLAVGLAHSVQIVPVLPVEPHDECLDALITERGFYPIKASEYRDAGPDDVHGDP